MTQERGEARLLRAPGRGDRARPGRVRVLAEYGRPGALVDALDELGSPSGAVLDVYSPYAVPDLEERLGIRRSRLPWVVLAGGVVGGAAAYLVQWYTSVHGYPLNVGGRPLHSAPAFVLITFEMTVLFAAAAGFFGLLLRLGLPRPWNRLQEVPGFDRASVDRFFLAVEEDGPEFDAEGVRRVLERTDALRVLELQQDGESGRAPGEGGETGRGEDERPAEGGATEGDPEGRGGGDAGEREENSGEGEER